jgi:hypothetical protein
VRARELLLAERARPEEGTPQHSGDGLRSHLHYLRARVLFESGRTQESRRALDRALASPGGDAGEWRAEAESLRRKLDSAVSPHGGRGKDFSSIRGNLFPLSPRSLGGRSGPSPEILVKSNT